MKPQAFQPGELRDEYDQIIRAGAYGKKTPFVNSDNSAILDYIMNNFDALYAQIPNGRAYVKSVNNITPDSNGNVTVNVGTGGGGTGGTNITVDSTLSSTSTNPVQNKVLYAALNNKLDKNGTATYATRDSSGNIISSTYAKKTDLNSYVKSINNVKPDSAGNVNISSSGGGSNITIDATLSGTSSNAIANKAVYAALENKLDKTGTAAAATKATQDSSGNVIINTYATKNELSGCVKSINNITPDSSGNVNISTSGGGANITVDTVLSANSANAIANKAVYNALSGKLGVTDTAEYAKKDAAGNVIVDTYAKKADISGVVKSVNGTTPDSNGNVNISAGGGDGVSTSVANNWSAQQNFQHLKFSFENFATLRISGTYDSPATSVATYNVTGALTLDMSTLVGMISNGDTSIFTAYIASNGSYALSITNAGTLKYAGSAADLAITASGLLLNIFLTKNPSGVVTSIAQATKLSRGA